MSTHWSIWVNIIRFFSAIQHKNPDIQRISGHFFQISTRSQKTVTRLLPP